MCENMEKMDVWLRGHSRCTICFSGGLDSTALLCNCIDYIPNMFELVFADLPMTTDRQRSAASSVASKMGCELTVIRISTDEMKDALRNDEDRCYHCKRVIYGKICEYSESKGIKYILSGDNYSDLKLDRPGRRAAAEFGVFAPFEELCIERKDIESYIESKGFDLIKDTCMATRYRKGTPLTEEMLRFAEECESQVRKLSGLRQLRIRIDGKRFSVQTSEEEIPKMMSKKDDIKNYLLSKGASEVEFFSEGYRTV